MKTDKKKKVLITGGAGFVGYFLAQKLARQGAEIMIVDNLQRGRMDEDLIKILTFQNISFIKGDLTDKNFFETLETDFDYIYHLAAVIGVKNVMQNPDKVLYINAVSILNLFEYAKNMPHLKKILFSSTSEIYAGTLKHFSIPLPTDETVALTVDDIKSGRSTYALSKMFGESVCFNYGRKFGIPFTVVRFHNVYGPRMGYAHVIPEMFIKISANSQIDVPSAEHSRAFCFVDDAVEMTLRLGEDSNAGGEIYHIGNSGQEISIKSLVLKIAQVMGKEISINALDPTEGSPVRRCPDTSKAERQTGYRAKVFLTEGIEKTYKWYKRQLDKRFDQK